mmetsp:Transcript_62790/g.138137  ORF Transcript_62790/g.138137 Transcript_62790/m.138137 type:complete len:266 (-) Transcript_62790:2-799(-)
MTHVARLVACLLLASPFCVRGLKLLHVGASRTGTQSLYTAMKILRLKALHSAQCYEYGCQAPGFRYLFLGGALEPVLNQFEAFDVVMDEPWYLMYPEVMDRYPEAKYILTKQPSPEEWYMSFHHLFDQFYHIPTVVQGLNLSSKLETPRSQRQSEFTSQPHQRTRGLDGIPQLVDVSTNPVGARYFNCEFTEPVQTPDMVQRCLEGYKQHNANVLRMIPPEKLLVFNLTDGWEPLCKFLDVPVPSEPFPFVDVFTRSPWKSQTLL